MDRVQAQQQRRWTLITVVALATLGLASTAAAKGPVSLQGWLAGGYHRSISLDDNGMDLRGGADLKLGPIALGIGGRFGTDRFDKEGTTRGAIYGNFTLFIPIPVVRPYLQLGAGPIWAKQLDGTGSPPRIGLHQGIGVDILIPNHIAIGVLLDVDENLSREGAAPDIGFSGLVVFKLRL